MSTEKVTPPFQPKSTKFWNIFERVIWTLVQAATATGVITIWSTYVNPIENKEVWVLILTPVLSAIKNALAVAMGYDTGATLPQDMAPVPAEVVAVKQEAGLLVASNALPIKNGTVVDIWEVAA